MQKHSKKSKKKALIPIAPGTPLRQFRKFKDLPYEIREQIWDAAARLPRIVGITFTRSKDKERRWDYSLTSKTQRTPLLKTCSESRRAALAMESAIPQELDWFQWRENGRKVYFNRNVDTIVMSSASMCIFCYATRVTFVEEGSGEVFYARELMEETGWSGIQRLELIFSPYDWQSSNLCAARKYVFTGLKAPIKRLLLKKESAFIRNNGLGYMLDQKDMY